MSIPDYFQRFNLCTVYSILQQKKLSESPWDRQILHTGHLSIQRISINKSIQIRDWLGESDWNCHFQNSCNSRSNTFLWIWLGLQSITSLKLLHCLREVSRPHVERMSKCTTYTCKDKPDPQLHYNFNQVTNWILFCYLKYDLKSRFCEVLWERTCERRGEGIRKRAAYVFAHSLPMQCFCCVLSPVTTLLP